MPIISAKLSVRVTGANKARKVGASSISECAIIPLPKTEIKNNNEKGKNKPLYSQGQAPHRNLLSLSHTAMSQSGNESERQSKKQKLLSPDLESLQGPIPDLPPNADELRKRGKLIWHWDDSDDDEFEDFPPGKVYFAIEENYNARMTAKKELSEIRARRSSLKERKNTTEAQTDDKPKTGRWLCLQPYIPPPIYCRICKKSNDHMTKQCLRFDSSTVVHDVRCRLCLREDHVVTICPYRYYVPKGEKVGPGGKLVCICCQKEGGHPGEEWVGKAVGNYCRICSSTYDHRTEDCPVKKGREIAGGKFQSAMVDS